MKRLTGMMALCTVAVFCSVNTGAAIVFDFNDGTGLDNVGAGAAMTVGGVTLTTSDVLGWDGSTFTLDSDGESHETNISGSNNALGVNSATTPVNAGNDSANFDPGEAWIFSFNTNVYLNIIDLSSLGAGAQMTLSAPGITSIVINDDGGSADIFSLGDIFVSAGTLITIANSSATSTGTSGADSHDFRISELEVTAIPEPATLGLMALSMGGLFVARRFRV
jgi:hypothetical protein